MANPNERFIDWSTETVTVTPPPDTAPNDAGLKAGYEDVPRDEGGRWTSGGGGAAHPAMVERDTRTISQAEIDREGRAIQRRLQAAGLLDDEGDLRLDEETDTEAVKPVVIPHGGTHEGSMASAFARGTSMVRDAAGMAMPRAVAAFAERHRGDAVEWMAFFDANGNQVGEDFTDNFADHVIPGATAERRRWAEGAVFDVHTHPGGEAPSTPDFYDLMNQAETDMRGTAVVGVMPDGTHTTYLLTRGDSNWEESRARLQTALDWHIAPTRKATAEAMIALGEARLAHIQSEADPFSDRPGRFDAEWDRLNVDKYSRGRYAGTDAGVHMVSDAATRDNAQFLADCVGWKLTSARREPKRRRR